MEFHLGDDHPVTRARDATAFGLWAVEQAAKDFRYFAYLVIALWGQLDALATYGLGRFWWVAVGGTLIGGTVYVVLYHVARMPRERNRHRANRRDNFIKPKLAIHMLVQAQQIDEALDLDGAVMAATRDALSTWVRGLDMSAFQGEPEQAPITFAE